VGVDSYFSRRLNVAVLLRDAQVDMKDDILIIMLGSAVKRDQLGRFIRADIKQ